MKTTGAGSTVLCFVLTAMSTHAAPNNATIEFSRGQELKLGEDLVATQSAFADLDGDGDLDILAVQMLVAREVRTFPSLVAFANDGRGHFERAVLPPLTDPDRIIDRFDTADMDGDGDADILAWSAVSDGEPLLFRNDRSEGLTRVAITDLGIGGTDNAFLGWELGLESPAFMTAGRAANEIHLHTASAGATSTVVTTRTVPTHIRHRLLDATSRAWSDFNGDGHMDIASSRIHRGMTTFTLLQGSSDGTFDDVTATITPDPRHRRMRDCAWADMNGDARPDLLVPTGEGQTPAAIDVNEGAGAFRRVPIGNVIEPCDVACVHVADLDLDGDMDAVLHASPGSFSSIAENLGNLEFRCTSFKDIPLLAGFRARTTSLGDIDGDGDIDILNGTQIAINETR